MPPLMPFSLAQVAVAIAPSTSASVPIRATPSSRSGVGGAELGQPAVVRAGALAALGVAVLVPLLAEVAREAEERRRVRRLIVGEHDVGRDAVDVEGVEALRGIPLALDPPRDIRGAGLEEALVLLTPHVRVETLRLGGRSRLVPFVIHKGM